MTDKLRKALDTIMKPGFGKASPTMKPRFLTAWEREDYERERRGEKPLGPPGGDRDNTRVELGRRRQVMGISEVIHKEDLGWGYHGYVVELPGGSWSGYIATRDEAISRARMAWPFAEDDMSCPASDE